VLSDQTALHGLLNKIRDLGMTLLLVRQLESRGVGQGGAEVGERPNQKERKSK
jgi:hypothetical protein